MVGLFPLIPLQGLGLTETEFSPYHRGLYPEGYMGSVVNPMHHPIGSTIWRLFFILNRGILSSVDVGPFPIGWLMKIEGFETTLW